MRVVGLVYLVVEVVDRLNERFRVGFGDARFANESHLIAHLVLTQFLVHLLVCCILLALARGHDDASTPTARRRSRHRRGRRRIRRVSRVLATPQRGAAPRRFRWRIMGGRARSHTWTGALLHSRCDSRNGAERNGDAHLGVARRLGKLREVLPVFLRGTHAERRRGGRLAHAPSTLHMQLKGLNLSLRSRQLRCDDRERPLDVMLGRR